MQNSKRQWIQSNHIFISHNHHRRYRLRGHGIQHPYRLAFQRDSVKSGIYIYPRPFLRHVRSDQLINNQTDVRLAIPLVHHHPSFAQSGIHFQIKLHKLPGIRFLIQHGEHQFPILFFQLYRQLQRDPFGYRIPFGNRGFYPFLINHPIKFQIRELLFGTIHQFPVIVHFQGNIQYIQPGNRIIRLHHSTRRIYHDLIQFPVIVIPLIVITSP